MQPLTYLFDFEHTDDKSRPYVMQEFAVHGAQNLVLSDTLIECIMKDSGLAKRLSQDLAVTGMNFVDSHAPFGTWEDLDLPIESERETMLARKRLAMSIAADFGVDTITIHVGNAPKSVCDKGYSIENCDNAICRSLDVLLPYAEKLNMVICIENIWFPTNTPEKLLNLIRQFNSPHLGICYDAGHANLMKCDRGVSDSAVIHAWTEDHGLPVSYDARILEKLHPHIVNCHLHDNNGINDEHKLFRQGNIDWPYIIGLLKTAPRLRSFQSEVIPVKVNASIKDLTEKFPALFN